MKLNQLREATWKVTSLLPFLVPKRKSSRERVQGVLAQFYEAFPELRKQTKVHKKGLIFTQMYVELFGSPERLRQATYHFYDLLIKLYAGNHVATSMYTSRRDKIIDKLNQQEATQTSLIAKLASNGVEIR